MMTGCACECVRVSKRIHSMDVERVARMVPVGMDFWASFRSPDLLEPAIIPTYECIKVQKIKLTKHITCDRVEQDSYKHKEISVVFGLHLDALPLLAWFGLSLLQEHRSSIFWDDRVKPLSIELSPCGTV